VGKHNGNIGWFSETGPPRRTLNEKIMSTARDQDGVFHQPDLFRVLLDQSTDAIQVVDPETLRLLDVNQTACIQLGYSREEMLLMSIFDLDPNLNERFRARADQQLRESGFAMFETEHRRKDGSTFPGKRTTVPNIV
jgi:PAS domain S-box-containing protein